MSSKQIKIEDYFNIMHDDNGRVFGKIKECNIEINKDDN